jgi:uncharacterized protein (TIGR02001 family)
MKNVKILAALGLLTAAGVAQAEVTGTAALVSDYDFRGFSQTSTDPAVQLSIDYAHDSGWYIGTWGSNIDQDVYSYGNSSASIEVDIYTGFRGTAGNLGWDVGLNYYTYPGASDFNYGELYGKLTYSVVTAGLYWSNDFGGKATGDKSDSALYVFGDAAIPVGPLSVTLHVGYSDGNGIKEAVLAGVEKSYLDYAVGLSYSASNVTLGVKWISYDADDFGADDRVVLSVSTALPWE